MFIQYLKIFFFFLTLSLTACSNFTTHLNEVNNKKIQIESTKGTVSLETLNSCHNEKIKNNIEIKC